MKIQVPDVTAPAADCSGLLGRTSLRRHVEHFFRRGPQLFRPSRPDFIETNQWAVSARAGMKLFRPSRPDFIETRRFSHDQSVGSSDCSGLLGRTSLRRSLRFRSLLGWHGLFRPSRPDFIETIFRSIYPCQVVHTLFRPSRPDFIETPGTCSRPRIPHTLFRPSRPDFIETSLFPFDVSHFTALFRPSRPDFIETK